MNSYIIRSKHFSKAEDWKLIVSVLILMIMVFIRDMNMFYFTPMHFLFVCTIISIILPYESLMAFAFFHIPFEISILCTTDIPILFMLIIKSRKNNKYQFLFAGIVILFEFLHIKFGYEQMKVKPVELNQFIVYVIYVTVFSYLLFADRLNNILIKRSIKFYIIGSTFVLFVMFFHYISVGALNELIYSDQRFGNTYGEFDDPRLIKQLMYTVTNPNNAAFFSLTAFTLALYVKDVFKNHIFKIVCMSLLVLGGLLTTSRTWIILMGLVLVIYFLRGSDNRKIWFIAATITVIFVASQFGDLTDIMLDRVSGRFNAHNMETAGRRTELFKKYNDYMFSHPERLIYGTGVLRYNDIIKEWNSVHSGIQQVFVCYGFMGITLFVSIAIIFYRRYVKKYGIAFWNLVPFLACFLFDQTIQFLIPHMLLLPFTVCALPLKLKPENNK